MNGSSKPNTVYAAISTIVLALFSIEIVFGAFDHFNHAARPAGMGNAFAGMATDKDSIFFNPAGISRLRRAHLSFNGNVFGPRLDDGSDISQGSFFLTSPVRQGRWGYAGAGVHLFRADSLSTETQLTLAYATPVPTFGLMEDQLLSLGGSAHFMRRSVDLNSYLTNAVNAGGISSGSPDPVFDRNGRSVTALGFDLGSLLQFGTAHRWGLGFSLQNVNEPQIGLEDSSERAPHIFRAGISHQPLWGLISVEFREAHRLENKPDTEFGVGFERRFRHQKNNHFALRFGYEQGSRDYEVISTGFSYALKNIGFDYGLRVNPRRANHIGETHQVGVSYQFHSAPVKTVQASRAASAGLLDQFTSNQAAATALLTLMAQSESIDADSFQSMTRLIHENRDSKWDEIKLNLLTGIDGPNRGFAHGALEYFKYGNPAMARFFIDGMDDLAQKEMNMWSVDLLAAVQLASTAYRNNDKKNCIKHLQEIKKDLFLLPEIDQTIAAVQTSPKMIIARR